MPHVSSRPTKMMDVVGCTICVVGFRHKYSESPCWPSYNINLIAAFTMCNAEKKKYVTFCTACTINKYDVHAPRLQSIIRKNPQFILQHIQQNGRILQYPPTRQHEDR